ncbi:hypothetical protein LTR53_002318 [Teratosphaeriaceae sp. CCFEE 6253]|nr:hypothetical protein LTR53_002318 [Teratosphaeriaceae sp. CCFEE 6253]
MLTTLSYYYGGLSKDDLATAFDHLTRSDHLQSGRDRWLIVQESDGSVNMSQYTASACARFAEDQGGNHSSRNPTKIPSKSPKRTRDDAESRAANERQADSEELGESSGRKRQRHSADSFDSAIAGITELANEYVDKNTDGLSTDIDWVENTPRDVVGKLAVWRGRATRAVPALWSPLRQVILIHTGQYDVKYTFIAAIGVQVLSCVVNTI